MKESAIKYLLLFILAIGVFFRFWNLHSIPPGVWPDEAINGNEALRSLKKKDFKLFYPENNGREGLFMWLLAFSFYLFGVSVWSLKFISALTGSLTILGTFLFSRELFNAILPPKIKQEKDKLALLTSFFISVSFWHVNFSRIAFRAVLFPCVMVFSSYFFWKGLNKLFLHNQKSYSSFIFSGAIFALGFYTYTSFRMAVPLFGIILIALTLLAFKRRKGKEFLLFAFLFLFSTFLVALPLGLHFLKNPEYFTGRASQVFFFNQPNPVRALTESIILHLGMFNFYGDQNWRHNLPGSPQLWAPVGIFFLIGLFFFLKKSSQEIKQKKYYTLNGYLFLLCWLGILLAPGFLTYEGIPHSLRSIGIIPTVYIFVSLGALVTYRWISERIKNKEVLQKVCLLFLFLIIGAQGYRYFIKWGKSEEAKNAFCKPYVEIGNYLNSLPDQTQAIVIVNRDGVPVPWPNGIPMPAQTVMFIENTKYQRIRSQYILPEEIDKIELGQPTVIVPLSYEEDLFNKLEKTFPKGETKETNNKLLIYKI